MAITVLNGQYLYVPRQMYVFDLDYEVILTVKVKLLNFVKVIELCYNGWYVIYTWA